MAALGNADMCSRKSEASGVQAWQEGAVEHLS